jgi:hypothetical protein
MLLADDGPTHTLVAGTVDEADAGGAYGAAAVTFGRAASAIRLVGWAIADSAEEAEREALGGRPVDYRDTPDAPRALGALGHGPAVDGLHRCLLAVGALRGGARAALVVETGGLASFAVVLSRETPDDP